MRGMHTKKTLQISRYVCVCVNECVCACMCVCVSVDVIKSHCVHAVICERWKEEAGLDAEEQDVHERGQ